MFIKYYPLLIAPLEGRLAYLQTLYEDHASTKDFLRRLDDLYQLLLREDLRVEDIRLLLQPFVVHGSLTYRLAQLIGPEELVAIRRRLGPVLQEDRETCSKLVESSKSSPLYSVCMEGSLHLVSKGVFRIALQFAVEGMFSQSIVLSLDNLQTVYKSSRREIVDRISRYKDYTVMKINQRLYSVYKGVIKEVDLSSCLRSDGGRYPVGTFAIKDICSIKNRLLIRGVRKVKGNRETVFFISDLRDWRGNQHPIFEEVYSFKGEVPTIQFGISDQYGVIYTTQDEEDEYKGEEEGVGQIPRTLITFLVGSLQTECTTTDPSSLLSCIKNAESGLRLHRLADLTIFGSTVILEMMLACGTGQSHRMWYFALKCMPRQPPRYICSMQVTSTDVARGGGVGYWIARKGVPIRLTVESNLAYSVLCLDHGRFIRLASRTPKISVPANLPAVHREETATYRLYYDSIRKQLYLVYVPREDDVSSPYTVLPLKITLY